MALTTFSVTSDDVLERVPFDTTNVGASSKPVSTGDIDTYIQDASSRMVAVLTRAGLDPGALNDDTERQIQDAIESYCVAEILDVIGVGSGQQITRYRQNFNQLLDEYKRNPSMLSTSNSGRVKSNISQSTTKPDAEFIDTDYRY